jgi:hypothetical protein
MQFEKTILRAGTLLYHGTLSRTPFEYPREKSWFAPNHIIAQLMARRNNLNDRHLIACILTFEVKHDVELVDFHRGRLHTYMMTGRGRLHADERQVANEMSELGLNGYAALGETMLVDPAKVLMRI